VTSSFALALQRLARTAAFALLCLAPFGAHALDVAGTCHVQFFATTTVHDFEGEAPCALLAIEAPDASGHYAARAEVAIAQIDTGISARNAKMRQTFEAKKFPRIVASFANVDPASLRAQRPAGLPFRIVIHGVERNVTAVLSSFSEVPGKSAHFRASFALALSEFGMKGPVAMGFIRVDDKVKVVVDVELVAKASPPPAAH
jgi:hypothetical protein